MNSLSVGGLVSGLDTNSIIEGLSKIEMNKVLREEQKRTTAEKKKDTFAELISRISNFAVKADGLSDTKGFNLFSTSSNDEELAMVAGLDGASPGEYELVVHQLATTQKFASKAFASGITSLGLSGEFELTRSKEAVKADPAKPTASITINANDSLKDIATKINAVDGGGVRASLLSLASGENRLVLTSVDEGTDHVFLKELSGFTLGAAGLGLVSDQQASRTNFNFQLQNGGAATLATTFGQLSTGVSANNLDAGDVIQITGTDAAGNAIATNFAIDPATTTVSDLVNHVQTAFGPDTAVSFNSSGEIVLTNAGAGTGEISMTMSLQDNGNPSTLALGSTKAQNTFLNSLSEGRRSFYSLDGMAVSSQSNKDDKTVVGTEFQLLKADPTTTVKLSLGLDSTGILDKVKGFVEEYNSVLKFIDEQSKVSFGDDEDDEDGSSKQTIKSKGPFAGDSTIRRIRSELQRIMTSTVAELEGKTQYTSLARVGITTSKSDGLLQIDSEKLEKAIKTDIDGVRRLFTSNGFSTNPAHDMGRFDRNTLSGTYQVDADTDQFDTDASATGSLFHTSTRTGDVLLSTEGSSKGLSIKAPVGSGSGSFTFVRGVASQLRLFVDQSNDYVDGLFKKTNEAYDTTMSGYDERIARLEEQVEAFRTRLTKQFASLEQSMQRLQSQSSAFLSQIGSLK